MSTSETTLFQQIFDELRLIKTEQRLSRVQNKKEVQQPVPDFDLSNIVELIKESEKSLYYQLESLTSLYATLNIKVPLPPMRCWAISPDFARLLANELFIKKPNTVVELGSGVSTLISAYVLRKMKHGKVFSFDHDAEFGAVTTENITLHELDGIAQVYHAPISEIMVGETTAPWYTISEDDISEKIDMLIIDGPPARTVQHARYPALPFFFDRLAEDAVVIMDDGIREEEKEICRRWLEEYPEFESEYVETEKGAFILRRRTSHHA